MAAQLQESYKDLEQKVADRTEELTALNAIAATVNESLDLDQTLDRALDELLQLLDLDSLPIKCWWGVQQLLKAL